MTDTKKKNNELFMNGGNMEPQRGGIPVADDSLENVNGGMRPIATENVPPNIEGKILIPTDNMRVQ